MTQRGDQEFVKETGPKYDQIHPVGHKKMKIKTILQINAILSIGLMIVLGLVFYVISQQMNDAIEKEKISGKIVEAIFELNLVNSDYLLHREERAKIQWYAKHVSLGKLLERSTVFIKPEEQAFLKAIQQDYKDTKLVFSRLVANTYTEMSPGEKTMLLEIERRLVTQSLLHSQVMVANAQRLKDHSLREVTEAQQNANIIITLLVGLITIIIAVVSFFVSRRVVRPIAKLQAGAQMIGTGNLNHRVATTTQDEIGDLSREFDQMTINLKALYDQQEQLHQELQKHQEHLEDLVKERTAELLETNEQLQKEIHQREQAEKKLQLYAEELEKSNSDLEDFAYIASHDLKEPLRGIHNFSKFLLEDYEDKLDQEGVAKLETLAQLSQRMSDLTDSLLYYSRVGRAELAYQATNLNEVIDEVKERLSLLLEEQNVRIDIPQLLPIVQCDYVRIKEVFHNLISNAVKYNDQPDKRIEIGCNAQSFIFYVRDNGIGIREKHFDGIFRIFKRLHGRNKFGGGVGVGLTFVQKILERHGGRIWVESTYGEGSTFYFTLSKEPMC